MVKIKEFRIGNYIEAANGAASIISITDEAIIAKYSPTENSEIFSVNVIGVMPVNLTEKVLRKLGLPLVSPLVSPSFSQREYLLSDGRIVLIANDQNQIHLMLDGNYWGLVLYLHRLQNVVHALTGNELIIEL